MRVIFMGTPDFAVGTLEAILAAGHEVVLAVTQPDRPKNRGKAMQAPPVKECARKHAIPVCQPVKIRDAEEVERIFAYRPDIIVVAAFGQILPKEILDLPRYGCINVHASLLPKYRGAAPIQWAVINGDAVSGVTSMRMDVGLDTGDMIEQREITLAEDETGGSLFEKLSAEGARLCVETMEKIAAGTAVFTEQDASEATHVGMISKGMGNIDWNQPAEVIERMIRGLNPWPSAYTKLNGKTLKIWRARVKAGKKSRDAGKIISVGKKEIEVQTGEGILSLLEVQLEGKKRMETEAFLRGYEVEKDTMLTRF